MTLLNLREYHRPETVEEALAALTPGPSPRAWGEGKVVPLAGGTALIGTGGPDVGAVVDLAELDLACVRADAEAVYLGAMTSLQMLVEASQLAGPALGIVSQAARLQVGRNLRVAATLGGTLAVTGPEDPLGVVLLALDAQVQGAVGSQRWAMPLDDFLEERGKYLEQGGLITEVIIPGGAAGTVAAFARVGRTPADRPIVCAAARLAVIDRLCAGPRLALGGVAARPVRLRQVEEMVSGKMLGDDLLAEAATLASASVSPPSDYRGSADYRRAMAGVLTKRVLAQAAHLVLTAEPA